MPKVVKVTRPEPYKMYNLGEAADWLRMDTRTLKKEIENKNLIAIQAGEQVYRILGENLLRYAGSASIDDYTKSQGK